MIRLSALLSTLTLATLAACTGDAPPADTDAPLGPCAARPLSSAAAFDTAPLFRAGDDGYAVYRIPSVLTLRDGSLLAFAEARPSLADAGSGLIDLVTKRSDDCGATWSALRVIQENGAGDVTNPTAVIVPNATGGERIALFFDRWPEGVGEGNVPAGTGPDSESIELMWSDDDGATWSAPRDLTADVKHDDWKIASVGPGHAIVTAWGNTDAPVGRLVVPGWFTSDAEGGSFTFTSDDGGETFTRAVATQPGTNESQVIERTDGSLALDGRQNSALASPTRQVYTSTDGAQTWSAPRPGLTMTTIMSSTLRLGAARDGDAADLLVHSGVAPTAREDLRVWQSADEGQTWSDERVLREGFTQYSVLTRLDDGTVGVVFESLAGGDGGPGYSIEFGRLAIGE